MKQFVLFIALISLLASCRSTRTLGKAIGKKDSTAKVVVVTDTQKVDTQALIRTTLQQMQANRINFTTFNAKVGVDYKGTDGKEHDVNANIKMYKDSAIWVSVNAILGIEAIRLLITKDSVKLLNKLEKTYAPRSINFLQEVSSLPLDFNTLQDLIIGNPVYLDSNIIRYDKGGANISFVSLGQFFKNLVTLSANEKVVIQSKLTDTDPFRNRTADLLYSDYEKKEGPLFPTKRQIVVSEKGILQIKLDFKNYSFNEEVSFPLSVPKNYTRH